jgi:hypothetical protein
MGVRITGEERAVGQSPWVPILYGDLSGWVNGRFLAHQVGWADDQVVAQAHEIVQALRDRNWSAVARSVHPERGVRFSPYAYVRAGTQDAEDQGLRFQAAQLEALAESSTVYRWGRYDGTGEPIDLTFAQYVDRFVYDTDFAQPDVVGYGEVVGRGNTINNIAEVYPDAVVVEYHFAGLDPQYMGMDWRSLRLVLEVQGDAWYLVGVVHDEWTI